VNGRAPWRSIIVAVGLVALALASPTGGYLSEARASTRPFVLPIPPGQTWYVCQGYNGQVTHQGTPALDLSLEPSAIGSRGCMAGSKYSSAGSVVSAPAAGTAYRWPGCCGDDFVCVNLDSGGSVALGHLTNRIASGARVATGGRIGTVAWPRPSNGDYAHIHIQVHTQLDCTDGSAPVAFDVAHGFKWACTPDLPYAGVTNQYSGLSVRRCDSLAPRSEPSEVDPPPATGHDEDEEARMMRMIVRSVEVLVSFVSGGPS
jgi:hypothetical protein